MPETRNLCAQLPLDLHQRVCMAREQSGLTTVHHQRANGAGDHRPHDQFCTDSERSDRQLCRALLLIIDDFGMERGTEYGLEQVYNVIDSRYRSKKPLIVTTNIPLHDLQHPQDTAHARIYDRLLEMCAPIRFSGENFRKATAQDKLARLKNLMD